MSNHFLIWCKTRLMPKIGHLKQTFSLTVLQRNYCSTAPHRNFSNDPEGSEGINDVITSQKVVKIAVVGVPNAGKSTFINNLISHRVCPASSKVHTTRTHAKAVYNQNNTQFILYDTPGLVNQREMKKHNLGSHFVSACRHSIHQSNLIAVLHDVSNAYTRNRLHDSVLETLESFPNTPSVLILNKVDTLRSKRILLDLARLLTENTLKCKERHLQVWKNSSQKFLKELSRPVKYKVETSPGWPNFSEIFMVSALNGDGLKNVLKYVETKALPQQWEHEAHEFTDQKPEQLILDSVRARLLDFLQNEIPYKLKCELEFFDIYEGKIIASVNVVCPNQRIEALVVGKADGRLKMITEMVTSDLVATFAQPITLTISTSFVKLRSDTK